MLLGVAAVMSSFLQGAWTAAPWSEWWWDNLFGWRFRLENIRSSCGCLSWGPENVNYLSSTCQCSVAQLYLKASFPNSISQSSFSLWYITGILQSGFLQIDSGHVKFLKHVLHASPLHVGRKPFSLAASPCPLLADSPFLKQDSPFLKRDIGNYYFPTLVRVDIGQSVA